jgi:hypothetical protein
MNPTDELILRDSAFTDAGEGDNPAGIVHDARYLSDFGVLRCALLIRVSFHRSAVTSCLKRPAKAVMQ